jgi:hypothetical protein
MAQIIKLRHAALRADILISTQFSFSISNHEGEKYHFCPVASDTSIRFFPVLMPGFCKLAALRQEGYETKASGYNHSSHVPIFRYW